MIPWILIIYILASFSAWSAPIPSKWRYEVHVGKANSKYEESRESVIDPGMSVKQTSYAAEIAATYWIIPKYIDFKLGARYLGISPEEPKEPQEQYQYTHAWSNLGLSVPIFGDFISLKIIGEIFYSNLAGGEKNQYGFKNITGAYAYPSIEFFPYGTEKYFSLSPFLRLPVGVGSDTLWQETAYGLNLRFPISYGGGRNRFPFYAYQKAIVIRLLYSSLKLNIEETGFLTTEIEHSYTLLTLGFEW
jgi:hypothetical protein